MPAVSKKQQNFMQAVANNPKFADKVGVNQSIGREFTKEKSMNTKRMNRLEELGRVDNEKAYTRKGKDNLMAEKKRVVGELKAKTGGMLARTGGSNAPMDAKGKKMMKGGKVKKMNMGGRAMADKAGAQAMNPRMAMAMEAQRKKAAMGGMMKGGKVKKMRMGGMADKEGRALGKKTADARGRAMKMGGKVGYEGGGKVKKHAKVVKKATRKSAQGTASKRADGIAQRGRTKGRIV